MLKKLGVILLLLVPIVFATSMINSTGTGNSPEGIDLNTKAVNLRECICNFSGECLCVENCLCGKGCCYRVGVDYNTSNDTAICPYNIECICNFSGECLCVENCLCGKGCCYRVGVDYNTSNDTAICPYNYNREYCRCGWGMYHQGRMYRGAHKMEYKGEYLYRNYRGRWVMIE